MAIGYRKDKKTGAFRAFGPVDELFVGQVEVVTKDGKANIETITAVSGGFDADGVLCCFGDIAPKDKAGQRRPSSGAAKRPETAWKGRDERQGREADSPRPRGGSGGRPDSSEDPNVLFDFAAQDSFRA